MRRRAPSLYQLRLESGIGPEGWAEEARRALDLGFDHLLLPSVFALPSPGGGTPPLSGAFERFEALPQVLDQLRSLGLGLVLEAAFDEVDQNSPIAREEHDWLKPSKTDSTLDPRPERPSTQPDYTRNQVRDGMASAAQHFGRFLAGAGIDGILARRAAKTPAPIWQRLVGAARDLTPDFLVIADTLATPPLEVEALAGAGFDFLLSSAAWWNLHDDWLIEEHRRQGRIAPLIAFPTPLDEPAPAMAPEELKGRIRACGALSAGFLLPASARDAVAAHSPHASGESFSAAIADVNALRARHDIVGRAESLERVTGPYDPLAVIWRHDGGHPQTAQGAVAIAVNTGPEPIAVEPRLLHGAGGGQICQFTEILPGCVEKPVAPSVPIELAPGEVRLFVGGEGPVRGKRRKLAAAEGADRRLEALAAERVAIEAVEPQIEGGRFPVKRVIGDEVHVTADIFCDGHDKIDARILYQGPGKRDWEAVPMRFVENDRWEGFFPVTQLGRYSFTIESWRDLFATWREEVVKKRNAGQRVALEIEEGKHLLEAADEKAGKNERILIETALTRLSELEGDDARLAVLLDEDLFLAMKAAGAKTNLTRWNRKLEVRVDRPAASFSAWYEIMPRSQSGDAGRHGTFDDVIARIPSIADMGFDVLYFPPIHPIGKTNRKGRNNTLTPAPDDPGSPYAIGSPEGGHDAIHPELGTLDDFRRMVDAANAHGLEVALDFAIQCSPDHPWIKEHPEWFDWRPDGTIKFAENPPKKYEDIVNVHFYRGAIPSLWYALRDVVLFWVEQGVKIFRVDNPHTKPLPFWEWMIAEVLAVSPGVVFLAEAFTRPKMMKRLGKVGYHQSYTYFTWRNEKWEIVEYMTELAHTDMREYYRPNFFPNTPDINPAYLQTGGRAGHLVRAVLAGTLSPSYGIYEPFVLTEATPVPGKEEYLDSEKYEIRAWDRERPGNIRAELTRLNEIRRLHPALRRIETVSFLNAWNDNILAYAKITADRSDALLILVNLDPHTAQTADYEVPLWEFGLPDDATIGVQDLFGGNHFTLTGKIQSITLDPADRPFMVWRLIPPGA
ncbi:alpha-1,4-glucan--maltose-1-phosphate maltosyltransferase [Lutibaculum baratangense]|uniref:Alpha-1,4-glucan:maltose-1-phosphate maltosyltransferase n=1 Tax=Lutibaculum baratangense AMV1 TaxID=631454 RepID=V4T7J0_9HYPH|nr:alpha-1,4-glucan--maltose-1-phosphate maltosyltransferase [Lutibaculum baratangense]ESR22588.1 Alpha-amylase [Lutibaculum baratangense AMV1]